MVCIKLINGDLCCACPFAWEPQWCEKNVARGPDIDAGSWRKGLGVMEEDPEISVCIGLQNGLLQKFQGVCKKLNGGPGRDRQCEAWPHGTAALG